MTFSNNMDRDQAPHNVEPDLRSMLFDIQYHFLLKTGRIAWDDLNVEDKDILSISQNVPEFVKGTVLFNSVCTLLH